MGGSGLEGRETELVPCGGGFGCTVVICRWLVSPILMRSFKFERKIHTQYIARAFIVTAGRSSARYTRGRSSERHSRSAAQVKRKTRSRWRSKRSRTWSQIRAHSNVLAETGTHEHVGDCCGDGNKRCGGGFDCERSHCDQVFLEDANREECGIGRGP